MGEAKPEGRQEEECGLPLFGGHSLSPSEEWQVIAETVPGASHLRAGLPNQDSILFVRESSIGLPIFLAISDGHGSDKCFRSDRGSRFAVEIGTQVVREGQREDFSDSQVQGRLPSEITRRWQAAVNADLIRCPLTEEELARLAAKGGLQARQAVEGFPILAYGATLLTVAVTQQSILYLQLGDGEILNVAETGEVTKPLAADARLIANETTSLCTTTSAADFRIFSQSLTERPPALILVTTDGYANSFSEQAGFHQVGSDLLQMLRADGFEAVNRSAKGWLAEATRLGSGDDCTLGLICQIPAARLPSAPDLAGQPEPVKPPAGIVGAGPQSEPET